MPINKGEVLLRIARASIAEALAQTCEPIDDEIKNESWLQHKAASFVTLTQHGQLRGCIGTLQAYRPLLEDVSSNARAAAFKDPRFSPLTADELANTEVEVSLLSPMQAMQFIDEDDALAQIRTGIDGLVFEHGHNRSTFLPQVWEQLPERKDFVAHLKQKAGLPADFWADDVKLARYNVSKWKEHDFEDQHEDQGEGISA